MPNYHYQPLKSPTDTRVLCLKPASRYNDELIGELLHISLDSHTPAPAYEALSYVWNNSSNTWTSAYNWSPPKIKFAFYPPKEGEEAPEAKDLSENDDPGMNSSGGQIVCDGNVVDIGSELFDALRRIRLPQQ